MNKDFDCVAMKHKAAEQIYERMKIMTIEEQEAFWAEQEERLRKRIETAKAKKASTLTP